MISKIKNFYFTYEHYFSPAALLAGFIFDSLTLKRIDLWMENLVIIVYLSIALLTIIFLTIFERNKIAPFVLQFTFGGLFSAFLIFYSRSASILTSWPFLSILVILLIGNELFRERYQKLAFRLIVFFVAIFSYSVFALPILLKRLGDWVFLTSGFVSLLLFLLVARLFKKITPEIYQKSKRKLFIGSLTVYLVFNFFYFKNIIPPIPLSLKEVGIYHQVVKTNDTYNVYYEPAKWYQLFKEESDIFHWQKGQPVYCFSSIFAPTKINTKIYHRWSFYNEESDKWQEESKLGFQITGGRDGGYRGYSLKYGIWPGQWRVDVVNERGQILSRIDFEIVEAPIPPTLKSTEK